MSDSNNREKGPSFSTLNRLAGMLPSFKEGMAKKMTYGGGKPGMIRRPRKGCPICGTAYDYVTTQDDISITVEHCERCQGFLNQGYVAFVSDHRFAFITPNESLRDMAGKVIKISSHVFDQLEDKFRLQSQAREDDNGIGNNPTSETAG